MPAYGWVLYRPGRSTDPLNPATETYPRALVAAVPTTTDRCRRLR